MAVRASSDNLSLDIGPDTAAPMAPVVDFSEVWAHRESLRQACTRLIGDPSRAEDLVQETFLSALKSGRNLERRESMGPWLATVARRRSIDELRGRQRLAVVSTPPEPAPSVLDDPAEQFMSSELVGQLRKAIATLTPRERQLLLRQANHGLSLSQLAAEEETSVASVRSVLTRARHKVRVSLERGGALGGLPVPRWLLSMRERTVRWALMWEPSLPSLTGAGAQITSAIVAVVTAVAMLLGGVGSTQGPDHSLSTIGFENAGTGSGGSTPHGLGGVSLSTPGSSGAGTAANPAARGGVPPSPAPLAPIPPAVSDLSFPVSPANPNKTHFTSLAVAEDGETLLGVGSGIDLEVGVVFRSLDGGRSWASVDDNSVASAQRRKTFRGGSLLVAPNYPADSFVFARTTDAIHGSSDGGLTWRPVTPSGSVAMSPSFSSGDPTLFISGRVPLEYNARTGAAKPLTTPFPPGGTVIIGPNFATSRELLIGTTVRQGTTTSAVIFTCTPGGCTQRASLPDLGNTPRLLLSKEHPGVMLAWYGMKVYRSTDYGYTFSEFSLPTGVTAPEFTESGGRIFLAGVTDTRTSDVAIHMSTDGAVTWTPLGAGTALHHFGSGSILGLPNGRVIAAPWNFGLLCTADLVNWFPTCPA